MRRRLSLLACAVLPVALCSVLWLALPVGSSGAPATQAGLADIQKKIDVTRWRIDRRKGKERTLTSDIQRWSSRIGQLEGRIETLQEREARIQGDLDAKRAELAETQQLLRDERARLARLRTNLTKYRATLAQRLRELYEADMPDLVTVILNADGFADLIERSEFLKRIESQDRRVIDNVRDAKADATATAERLDTLERRQTELTAAVLERRDAVTDVKNELIGTRVVFQRARDGKQQVLSTVRAQRDDLQEDLQAMEASSARIAEQLRAAVPGALPAGPIRAGSGDFIWPVNGPITGSFGESRPGHMHAGIDIAVPEGTPIRAAGSGTVVLMQPTASSGGYGNFTCVAHSQSTSTCYAHQSRFGTSMGASVTKGQVIGYVGNTGHSFGAHLHFEVRVNGSPVSPLAYL